MELLKNHSKVIVKVNIKSCPCDHLRAALDAASCVGYGAKREECFGMDGRYLGSFLTITQDGDVQPPEFFKKIIDLLNPSTP